MVFLPMVMSSALLQGASRPPLLGPGTLQMRTTRHFSAHRVHLLELPTPREPATERKAPAWVGVLNASLEKSALSTLLAYLLIDITSTLSILGLLVGLRVPVAADFAIALALVKAVRGPRLALDAWLAAMLTRWFPSLKAVKVTNCFDEFAASLSVLRLSFQEGLKEGRSPSSRDGVAAAATRSEPSSPPRVGKLAAATRAARNLASDYGLAYMAAKNLLALLQVLLFLAALRSGGPAKAATAALLRTFKVSPKAGMLAGQLALAVTLHYLLFPVVVIGAAKLGPKIPTDATAKERLATLNRMQAL